MKQTVESFQQRQAKTLSILENLQAFLSQGETFGIEADQRLMDKLAVAIRDVQGGKLRIVLVGGFSEGKTAIAAAWLERLDKSTMKISAQESSNAVTVYETGTDCVLIDTPGLFGFKQQKNELTGAAEKYKEMTRKYVSEAHLVMYVMDPTNPIKDSHAEELTWLFRELSLLPRTVFVLSRFDAVADVEDEHDYAQNLRIKKENVVSRLRDEIALTDAEAGELSIVGVAANPFDSGTEHWLDNLEQFRTLSRIESLQRATADKVMSAGGIDAVVEDARRSIVRDILGRQLPIAAENDERIAAELDRLTEMNRQLKKQFGAASERIKDARIGLRTMAVEFFSDLIVQVNGQSLETFCEFFERNIGEGGIVLDTKLQNAFEQQLRSAKAEIGKMSITLVAEVDHFNATLRAYGKQGVDFLIKGNVINNSSVLAARDGVVNVAKLVGVDLGKMLKFKPWGAVKLAKGINGALAGLGLALELWDAWDQYKREQEFKKAVSAMVKAFEEQRKELLALINSGDFEARFFPEMVELREDVAQVEESVTAGTEKRDRFREWRTLGQAIDADFRMLD
ncbi:LeoA/HP0731 family dynamin-like GTPase [Cupriavidus plantarum]|uniref:50S ribosome-binding GTPase n=1 Tax=Cupriavidus plantarum TaxID=942865 RepID=A0A316F035_9BURK|nr:LeoA/HP0731 family dynamin-like GTPase [Cupriavidus plantarum]PWK37672.1 50S ribosome-binding GTPase [Cupriavidus plantarum]